MKRIPPVSELENDMKLLKSILVEMGKIIYKYDFDDQISTEEEYISNVVDEFDISAIKQEYESYIQKYTP